MCCVPWGTTWRAMSCASCLPASLPLAFSQGFTCPLWSVACRRLAARCPHMTHAAGRLACHRKTALEPIGAKKEVAFADFKSVMAGLTDTTPTKDIVNAFKVFDKDVSQRPAPSARPSCPPAREVAPARTAPAQRAAGCPAGAAWPRPNGCANRILTVVGC